MSKNDNIEPEKVDDNEKKVERARSWRHQVKPSDFFFIGLIIAAVTISIFIIEIYQ